MRGIRFGAFVLAGMLVAACGDSGRSELVVEATPAGISRAVRSTVEGESARFTAELEMAVMGQSVSIPMEGAYDGAGRSEMVVDMSAITELAGPDAAELRGLFSEPMRMVADGRTMYLCGGFVRLMAAGAECGSIDLPDLAASGLQTSDPLANLRSLVAAGDVEEVGREEVGGVDTVHLRGTVTMREGLAQLEVDDAEALRAQLGSTGADVEAFLDTPVPFDLWIDGDDHIRRFRQTFDLTEVTPGAGRMTIDMRLHDFGAVIEIELPDPSSVVDLMAPTGLGN